MAVLQEKTVVQWFFKKEANHCKTVLLFDNVKLVRSCPTKAFDLPDHI